MRVDVGSLGYIPEIYDSAQEGFPFIYVNGEKYDFSPEVLMLGERLVESYYRLPQEFRVATLGGEWLAGTRAALEEFDRSWATYEQVALKVFRSISANLLEFRIIPSPPLGLSSRRRRRCLRFRGTSNLRAGSFFRGRNTISCGAVSARRSAD